MKAMHFALLLAFPLAFGCAGTAEGVGGSGTPPAAASPAAASTSPAPAGSSAGTQDRGALTGADAPCDVRAVLRTYCVNCHQIATYYPQAPKLAFTRSELATKDESGLTLGERVTLRLNDPKDPMPPAGYGVRPSEAERRTITDWLGADMPGGACAE